jgi:hypothetical protein
MVYVSMSDAGITHVFQWGEEEGEEVKLTSCILPSLPAARSQGHHYHSLQSRQTKRSEVYDQWSQGLLLPLEECNVHV